MHDVKWSKRDIGGHWVEIAIRVPRTVPDTPDTEATGDDARRKAGLFMLAYVAGLARVLGDDVLASDLCRLARALDPTADLSPALPQSCA